MRSYILTKTNDIPTFKSSKDRTRLQSNRFPQHQTKLKNYFVISSIFHSHMKHMWLDYPNKMEIELIYEELKMRMNGKFV